MADCWFCRSPESGLRVATVTRFACGTVHDNDKIIRDPKCYDLQVDMLMSVIRARGREIRRLHLKIDNADPSLWAVDNDRLTENDEKELREENEWLDEMRNRVLGY